MSQVTIVASSGGGGGGTVTSVSGGNNITITGNPAVNPTVNVSGTFNHSLLIGNATNSISSLTAATNGQLPIGNTGANPIVAALTPGDGIQITNGAGSITIAATATTFTWVEVITSSQAMDINTGYLINEGGAVLLTLPATAPQFSRLQVLHKSGSWAVLCGTGQTIYFGNQQTTTGIGGSLGGNTAGDGVSLICITADTEWRVEFGPQGNLVVE